MGVDHKFLTGKQAAAYKADGMFSFLNWFRSGISLQKMQIANPLAGKPLRYLIGADDAGEGVDGEITEVPWGMPPVKRGISIGYCNLFDERDSGQYGPYLKNSQTADEYHEGEVDPSGPGWRHNLEDQFHICKVQGFEYIELDNPDAYSIKDVIGAIELAGTYGLKVIAKNPGLMGIDHPTTFIRHPNVYGAIVEKGADNPLEFDATRRAAGKPDLPVWFVAFEAGERWAKGIADMINQKGYRNMGVSYSARGEYATTEHILRPRA